MQFQFHIVIPSQNGIEIVSGLNLGRPCSSNITYSGVAHNVQKFSMLEREKVLSIGVCLYFFLRITFAIFLTGVIHRLTVFIFILILRPLDGFGFLPSVSGQPVTRFASFKLDGAKVVRQRRDNIAYHSGYVRTNLGRSGCRQT